MEITRCDRCGKDIKSTEVRLIKTKEIILKTIMYKNDAVIEYPYKEREYDLCPECHMAFTKFMERETPWT